MPKRVRVRSIRRKQVDEDKLALAFLLLAKILHERKIGRGAATSDQAPPGGDREAA
jgi:hypothetical protein